MTWDETVIKAVESEMISKLPIAVERIWDIAEDPNTPTDIRLRAYDIILTHAMRQPERHITNDGGVSLSECDGATINIGEGAFK